MGRTRLRAAAIVSLVAGITYVNVSLFFEYAHIGFRMPLPATVRFFFNIHTVFSGYQNVNQEYVVWGRLEPEVAERTRTEWIRLDIDDYVPFKIGEQLARLYPRRHTFYGGQAGQRAALAVLSRRIRNRYNRENPGYPIREVLIQQTWWPREEGGYYHGRTPESIQSRTHFQESWLWPGDDDA